MLLFDLFAREQSTLRHKGVRESGSHLKFELQALSGFSRPRTQSIFSSTAEHHDSICHSSLSSSYSVPWRIIDHVVRALRLVQADAGTRCGLSATNLAVVGKFLPRRTGVKVNKACPTLDNFRGGLGHPLKSFSSAAFCTFSRALCLERYSRMR